VTVRQIREFGDPVLREVCQPIEQIAAAEALIRDLEETCALPGRAGVAANQIGVALRAFAYSAEGVTGYLINPELLELRGEPIAVAEGCLSLPGLWFDTPRYPVALVRGQLLDGNIVEMACEGLLAQVMQHECDHLEGKLFIDRLDQDSRKQALRQLRSLQDSSQFLP
jgi:peptide deformylase